MKVEAGLFSSFWGDQAYANTQANPNTIGLPQPGSNSQNIALLRANVSSASIFQDKSTKNKGDTVDTSASVNVSDNALAPETNPLIIPDKALGADGVRNPSDVSVYVIRKGDTILAIASMFGVSVNTILSANDIKKGDKLVEGSVLLILPISGLEHTVAKGQTLQGIANLYKVEAKDIIAYNDITSDTKLAVGDKLIIPNGEMTDEGGDKPAANLGATQEKDKNYYTAHPVQSVAGYFINPAPSGIKTQGLHGPGNRGVDIAAPTGNNVYVSASGVVIVTKTGCAVGYSRCGGGYGNMVIVQHPNGTKTLYGHMSKVSTSIGETVSQGQVVGLVGSTGRSTGPHLHFEVFNAKNPGADWSWKR